MALHELKTDSEVFWAVKEGKKNFEIRLDDRGFQVGDRLLLRETENTGAEMRSGVPLKYTGFELQVDVTYILRGPVYGLMSGWVIMSIR